MNPQPLPLGTPPSILQLASVNPHQFKAVEVSASSRHSTKLGVQLFSGPYQLETDLRDTSDVEV